jgi:3-oxoacyl-[acyl-carrier-protein] synthase II
VSHTGTDRGDHARRVVVTGLGATTPLGGNVASTWAGMLAGRSGVAPLTDDWAQSLPVRIAARAATDPSEVLDRIEARKLDRTAQFALIAAREAWADAGLSGRAGDEGAPTVDPDRFGVVIGTGIGGVTTLLNGHDTLRERGARAVSPHAVPMLMANSPAANVSINLNARAGAHTTLSACASGAEAIGHALDMIRLGRADMVIAGGTEACVIPLPIAAFGNMMALSKRNDEPERASRPFDKNRDGFVLGEGAGVLVLETAEHAAARGARVYAELSGIGFSSDAHHIAQPEPTGRGIATALRYAFADGAIDPAEVVHVNAHATSTPLGDLAEIKALREVLGADADHVSVSSTKSMTGHLLGAAGAIESVAVVKTIETRTAPPTINVEDLDDAIDMDVVRGEPRPLPADRPIVALNDAFGFGGHNVVLAFRSV